MNINVTKTQNECWGGAQALRSHQVALRGVVQQVQALHLTLQQSQQQSASLEASLQRDASDPSPQPRRISEGSAPRTPGHG